jgi:hypothetical protein
VQAELHQSLLDHPSEYQLLYLLALCAFGAEGRHRIFPEPDPKFRGKWDVWLETLPEKIKRDVKEVWRASEERASRGVRNQKVRVMPNISEYKTKTASLSPKEALSLLGRPLRVIVENARNDRRFILAFADSSTRDVLGQAEKNGWLVFDSAGGIGELEKRIETVDTTPLDALRSMYLCDSDAKKPQERTPTAQKILEWFALLEGEYSRQPKFFGQVLERRAAENYAPPARVFSWARDQYVDKGTGSRWVGMSKDATKHISLIREIQKATKPEEKQFVAALALDGLQNNQIVRSHLDMKEGRGTPPRSGQQPNYRTDDTIWGQLNDFQQAALLSGFGNKFSEEFYSTCTNLNDETGEIKQFLQTMLERL